MGRTGLAIVFGGLVAAAPTGASADDADDDFAARCAQADVVKCVGFDDVAELGGDGEAPSGTLAGAATPELDSSTRASGASSLMFTIPSNSPADTSGSYFTNFSDDLSVQFGGDEEFYVQWRQRFSPELVAGDYAGGGGWKQAIIGTGNQPGQVYYSCTALEVVTNSYYHNGFPMMYNSCTGSASHGPYDGFQEPFSDYDFKLQNARPEPYCLYSQSGSSYFPPDGNCSGYLPDEWMTFQVGIQTGPRVGDEFVDSMVRLWIASEGEPAELAIEWGPYNLTAGDPSENQMFGKVWLLPYNTGKDSSESHPTAYTWYDELIISRSRISDPGSPPSDDSGGSADTGTNETDGGDDDTGPAGSDTAPPDDDGDPTGMPNDDGEMTTTADPPNTGTAPSDDGAADTGCGCRSGGGGSLLALLLLPLFLRRRN